METKTQERALKALWVDPVLWTGLCVAVYLAVLPMADTIALRNVALAGLLFCLAWQFQSIRSEIRIGWPVLLWAGYLFIFPMMADDHRIAWQSLEGQWGRGLLAMIAGAGAAIVLNRRYKGMLVFLGVISAVPILVHLGLFAGMAFETGSMPWGYWGRETHHADLGYAASVSVILLLAAFFAGGTKTRLLVAGLTIAALFSTIAANSRAGIVFSVFGGLLVLAPAIFFQVSKRRNYALAAIGAVLVIAACVLLFAFKVDPRWRNLGTMLEPGFLGDAVQIECGGEPAIAQAVRSKYGTEERTAWAVEGIVWGDGSRVMLLRAGTDLALKHPWGSDGSRQAFQKLLRQECAEPAISMAHAHNGWLDTMLAIGWLGAALYLGVLLAYLRQGWQTLRSGNGPQPWAVVLAALAVFWVVRGFTDSVFRDHMLEMQGFMLAYAATSIRVRLSSDARPSDAPEPAPQATSDSGR